MASRPSRASGVTLGAIALAVACGGAPTDVAPPSTTAISTGAAPAPVDPCEVAAAERTRATSVAKGGGLHRALRALARADARCPVSAPESTALRAQLQRELEPGTATARELFEAGLRAFDEGDGPAMQRAFDRAIVAAERAEGAKVTLELPAAPAARVPREEDVAFSPDGALVAEIVGARVAVGELAPGVRESRLLGSFEVDVEAIAFSPDGKTFAAGASDGSVVLWDTASWKERARFSHLLEKKTIPQDYLDALAFSPDGSVLVTATTDGGFEGTLRLWDTTKGAFLRKLKGERAGGSPPTFSPDGTRVYADSYQSGVREWSVKTGALTGSAPGPLATGSGAAPTPIGGKHYATVGPAGVSIVEAQTKRVIRGPRAVRHDGAITALRLSMDGKRLATGSGNAVRLWSLDQPAWVRVLGRHGTSVTAVDFSPDRKTLVACTVAGVQAWSAETFEPRELAGARAATSPRALAYAPNGTLAIASEEAIVLARSSTDSQPARVPLPKRSTIEQLSISPDGAVIGLSVAGGSTYLFDLPSGAERGAVAGGAVAFRPGGGLATANGKLVGLFDLDAKQPHRTFSGHADDVRALGFSPDGAVLASAGSDKTLRLWDVASGRATHEQRSIAPISELAFFPSGGLVTSAGDEVELRTGEGAPRLVLRPLHHHDGGYALLADGSAVELLGPDVDAAASALRCRVGALSFPFELCRDRFELQGLTSKVVAGANPLDLQP